MNATSSAACAHADGANHGATQRIIKIRRDYNTWVANETLEDYALQHAREDEMKISVFTGPYFDRQDPEMYGVRIPLAFWKVIAFIHDDTGKLCATGYEMNQESTLEPEEEFVFGQHETAQVSIASIEQETGISFGPLAAVDPFEDLEGVEPPALTDFRQIRFVRGG